MNLNNIQNSLDALKANGYNPRVLTEEIDKIKKELDSPIRDWLFSVRNLVKDRTGATLNKVEFPTRNGIVQDPKLEVELD